MDKEMIPIGFDIDGVALKYKEKFCEVFKKFGGETDISKIKKFSILDELIGSDIEKERKAAYMSFAYMMNQDLDYHKDFWTVFKYVLSVNGVVKFITARQKDLSCDSARRSLKKMMGDNFFIVPENYITIDCVGQGETHGSKVPLIKKYGMKYFVEDKRSSVLEMAKEGIIVFMPRRPWNELPEHTPNVIQYDNANEIVSYFKKPN